MLSAIRSESSLAQQVYTRGFLTVELPTLARTMDEDAFTQFQCQRLRSVVPGFDADSLSVTVRIFQADGSFIRSTYVGRHRVPENIYQKYLEFMHLDVMRDANRSFRGTLIRNTDFMDLECWRNNPFYDGFMRPMGRHHTAIISYPYPYKRELELRFNYQTAFPDTFADALDKDLVEYVNLPFYVAWLYRLNAIDDQTMTQWLSLLIDLNPFDLAVLRKVCSANGFNIEEASEALSCDAATIECSLYALSQYPSSRAPGNVTGETSYEWLLNLGNQYSFLRHAGEYVPVKTLRHGLVRLQSILPEGAIIGMHQGDLFRPRLDVTERN